MSKEKKKIRENFRNEVFQRDGFKCRVCGEKGEILDAHHIESRTLLAAQGMVKENGISLCPKCHEKAEEFWSIGTSHLGYSREDLYSLIGSSLELATQKSNELEEKNQATSLIA